MPFQKRGAAPVVLGGEIISAVLGIENLDMCPPRSLVQPKKWLGKVGDIV
jgi:hypothetical protein